MPVAELPVIFGRAVRATHSGGGFTDLPFMKQPNRNRCCKTDPCQATPPATCPKGDLTPAFIDRPDLVAAYVSADTTSAPKKTNIGAIVGGVVGGVAVLAIVGVLIFFCLRKKRRSRKTEEIGEATSMIPMTTEKGVSQQQGAQSRKLTWREILPLILILM